ncbi:MAG: MATE family efflux transporter [Lachnospiraceae bacterium]|nr:MATE family efflux transporter [Lachnospiraceae bacterium]
MGTEAVPKVMLSMGIPIILSMVLQACYNIVDSMFVARIPDTGNNIHMGEYAVNALTLAFPVQMLIVAFGIGTGVGVNALLAKSLGQRDEEKVAKTAGNGVTLALIIYAAFLLFGLFGVKAYIGSQTKDEVVLEMGISYLSICCVISFGIVLFSVYEKLLQSTGKTIYSTIAQVTGAIVNIVLDPIMIFGYFGLPEMGIRGAAYATVIGQVASMLIAMYFHYKKNTEVKSGRQYLKLDKGIVKEIYVIGLPAIIMQALMSFMTYGVNLIFGSVSQAAVTAYGIFYKIQQFIFFAGFGLRDAITPIVSFNFGMGDRKRVKQGIFYGILYTEIIMLVGMIGLEVFASPLIGLFAMSKETEELCVLAVRIIATGFLFAGGNIAVQGVFQALGCGLDSLIVSLLRLCIVVLPLAWLFTKFANAVSMIWWAFPIAELVALAVAVVLMLQADRKMMRPMKEGKMICASVSGRIIVNS